MGALILLRHGESEWNAEDRFTGWTDVDLTRRGEEQARHAGRLLREAGLVPTAVHTSVLTRAVRTGDLATRAAGGPETVPGRHWRLNERHYGALQGRRRAAVLREAGEERFTLWRRSYDVPPPPADAAEARRLATDPRYSGPDRGMLPLTESLADVTARLLPWLYGTGLPGLRAGHTMLVVAHSNSLRVLVAHLGGLDHAEAAALDIPVGVPLCYPLDAASAPVGRAGRLPAPGAGSAGFR
jgi:2,3-bisphosphoglycerate-dependent phosphoglycerate mutase